MKVIKFLVLMLVFSVSLFAVESCKTKDFLEKTSLSYNVVSIDTSKTNFYDMYQNRQKIYQRLYNYIIKKKSLLTCSSDKECSDKASELACQLIFYVRFEDRARNFNLLLKDSGEFVASSLWRQSKNAWDIYSAFSPQKKVVDKIDYGITALNHTMDIITSTNFTKDEISWINKYLFPSMRDFVKNPNLDNINKLSSNVKNILKLVDSKGKSSKFASLVGDITKLIQQLDYLKLYNLALKEHDNKNSCINFNFFTIRELAYLDNLNDYIHYDIYFTIKDTFKDFFDLIGTDSIKDITQAVGAMLDSVMWIQTEKETTIDKIITFNDLINDKLDILDKEIEDILNDYNDLDITKFYTYLLNSDDIDKVKSYIKLYNENIPKLAEAYYPNELINPLQHKTFGSIYKLYYRNQYINGMNTIVNLNEKVINIYEKKKTLISSFLGEVDNCDPSAKYQIAIKGKNNQYLPSLMDVTCKNNQFILNQKTKYELDLDKAYKLDGKSSLYYFKFYVYKIIQYKNRTRGINVPIYVKNGSIRFSKIEISDIKTQKGHPVLKLEDNFGLIKFYYDKDKAKLLRLTDTLNLNGDLKKYVLDDYSSPEGIHANMNIIDFKLLMEKNLDDLKVQGMDFRATKYYKWLEKEFNNNIINKKELYVPAWFSKLYTTTLLRFEHYMIKNKKYNVQAKEYENWYLDKFINSTVDTKIRFKLLVYLYDYKRRFFKKYKYLPIYKNLLIFNYLSNLASKGEKK